MLENHMVVGPYYNDRKWRDDEIVRCEHCGRKHHADDCGDTWCFVFTTKDRPGERRCMDSCVFFCRDCDDEYVDEEGEICKSCAEMALCGY